VYDSHEVYDIHSFAHSKGSLFIVLQGEAGRIRFSTFVSRLLEATENMSETEGAFRAS
jgi:hypothetical protein